MVHTLGVLVVAVLSTAPPARWAHGAKAEPPVNPACPAEPTLELLHDAVFHLDRGGHDARVRQDLGDARARIAADETGAGWARGFIARIGAALERDASTRQYESEVIRKDLHESPCLPTEMHERFHRSLPPPGPPPRVPPRGDHP